MNKKKRIVVIGTGWAGARVARDLNLDQYDLSVISLRNHMVFTPLLPSTTTGKMNTSLFNFTTINDLY